MDAIRFVGMGLFSCLVICRLSGAAAGLQLPAPVFYVNQECGSNSYSGTSPMPSSCARPLQLPCR
jgi:hypothetical protein